MGVVVLLRLRLRLYVFASDDHAHFLAVTTPIGCFKMAEAEYDLVIFGASGFTGQFVVEEVARTIEEEADGLRWAIAGRNMHKLQAVLDVASNQTG